MSLTYRWLGVAGLEFTFQDFTLLIDPFFTRPGKASVMAGRRVKTDERLVGQYIPRADAVLVTHPHYDHLLDVPAVMRKTGARAFGSPNTCALLGIHGIAPGQIQTIQLGDQLQLGPFNVGVFPNHHTRIPFSRWFNGPLPPRLRRGEVRLPLRLSDYRMDECYSFNIRVNGMVMQIGKHPVPADALFISPYRGAGSLEATLQAIRPKWIIPIHWDDFMRPLSIPLRTMLLTPAQGLHPLMPPVRRLDLKDFTRAVQHIMPETDVRVPNIFEVYHF